MTEGNCCMSSFDDLPASYRAKVNRKDADSCWTWTAATNHAGYGLYSVARVMRLAHRVSYELLVGPLHADMVIDHRCFEPSCVNPGHLRQVTRKQNNEHRRGAQLNSKSGIRGVSWHRASNRWRAQVKHKGLTIHVGNFKSIDDATQAVMEARQKLFTHDDGKLEGRRIGGEGRQALRSL